MLPDWAPNAHPLIVHFPIALFVTAIVADLVQIIRKKDDAFAAFLYLAAGLGALASFLSGRSGADAMMVPAHVVADLNAHADWGLRAVWFLGVFGVVRVGLWRFVRDFRPAIRFPMFVIALAGMYVVWETAEHGGQLVFGHGLGTSAGMAEMAAPPPPAEAGERLQGAWTWTPDVGLESLLGNATVIAGPDVTPPRIEYRNGQTVLAIDGPATLLVADTTSGIQFDVRLAVDAATGEVDILHNATDGDNYHYLRIEEDLKLEQGVRTQGSTSSMSSGRTSTRDWQTVRVVGEGTHYRAYIDGPRVTHGHGEPAPRGRVGIRVSGGTVYIASLSVTPIE